MCYVPPGAPHRALNLSATSSLTVLEFRTDADLTSDVVLLPELAAEAGHMAKASVTGTTDT